MSENKPFTDHAGLLRCPHCGAVAVLIYARTVHHYRRAQQRSPGQWAMDAEDPQPCDAGEGVFHACEACRAVLGAPDPGLLERLDAQVPTNGRRPIR